MRKILVICLLLGLVSCGNKTIGKLSGTEKQYITIADIQYVIDSSTSFSNVDREKFLIY